MTRSYGIRPHSFALLLCAAPAALAGPLDEPHLNIIARTEAEQARIDAALSTPNNAVNPFEENSAGAATVRPEDLSRAFSQPAATITFDQTLDFELGNALFSKIWVSSPSSTKASDGLGPLYNARSCRRCHINDGRGHPPNDKDALHTSFLLRAGIPTQSELSDYLSEPDPVYGSQIQDHALTGHASEAKIELRYEEHAVALAGGETVHLRKPVYSLSNLGYGPLDPKTQLSPRVAPQMIGLGLIEAIPAADILAHADPDDTDGDGISGRASIVWSEAFQTEMLGRFGYKAIMPTMLDQSAAAFSGDVGISSPTRPAPWGDCTAEQSLCRHAVHGDNDIRGDEIDGPAMDLLLFYASNLGVPARRASNTPEVLAGKALFHDLGCARCHQPAYVTHRLENDSTRSFQLIWPYTDLLLHDMGPGLDDGLPEGRATSAEWRTPPLWGIGLTKDVSGHTFYLHDGRARSLLEAVLWHGGEAQAARDAVISLQPEDRKALLSFLESL